MSTQFNERNISMVMDMYELTMSNGYLNQEEQDTIVAFDVFYRKNPDNAGFAVFAGLEQVIEYIQNLHFSEDDVEYLRSLGLFTEEFLQYLLNFKFKGSITAMPEGTIMFPNEPILTVVAPLIDAQLIETAILLEINHQSLIATKTNRIVRAAKGKMVTDFGARRAHNVDAAVYGARAAYIGGASGTATVLAGKMFGIPISGTMAHSWVMSFESEFEAFKAYAESYPKVFFQPCDGSAQPLAIEGQGQIQASVFKNIVFFAAGHQQGRKLHFRCQTECGGSVIDPNDPSLGGAESGAAHQIQKSHFMFSLFHDDPPHGI